MKRSSRRILIAIAVAVGAGCVSEPWGWRDASGPDREILLREFARRSRDGAVRSRERIEDLFPSRRALTAADPTAADEAQNGRRAVASAAWWGWDAANATEALQQAFRAPVDTLVIPAMQGPWLVDPLILDGPREVILEPGAVIMARRGSFIDTGDNLIRTTGQDGLRIIGYGARLVMRKADYRQPPYERSEWRHALAIFESSDVAVRGLSIESSGGDGVYIGQSRGADVCENILLSDVSLPDNHRQGVSVIAARGFRMEYTHIVGTRGTAPQAAIDFEPNSGLYGLTDCVVHRCLFERNAGAALTVFLVKMDETDRPVDIRIQETVILGHPLSVFIRGFRNGVRGRLEFVDTSVRGYGNIQRSGQFEVVR